MHHKNVYVPLFYSISTTFVPIRVAGITLEHALSRWRPRHFVKSIPRILRKREREISWRNKSPHTGGLYIYKRSTTFFPLFCPPSRYSFWNISQSPPSPPQTLVSTPFFFFVSFCRHRLSVTHCPRYCDNVLRVTKLYSLRRKEKLGPYKHCNTLVDVLKRVFPRFRSPSLPCIPGEPCCFPLDFFFRGKSSNHHIHFIRCILASAPVGDTNVTMFHPRVYRVVIISPVAKLEKALT